MQLFWFSIHSPQEATLDQNETQHCMKVLRHQIGDEIWGIDGEGKWYRARIVGGNRRETQLQIVESQENWGEKPQYIRFGVSPLHKKDRFEWFVEKAVELGANEIVPVICERTVKKGIKAERMQHIMKSALKQCKRSRLPIFAEPQSIKDFVQEDDAPLKLMPYCEANQAIQALGDEIAAVNRVSVLIGPEGDFTEEEVNWAKEAGWHLLSLGETRLRTETAAIYTLAFLKGIYDG